MEVSSPYYAYKETRLNLDSSIPGSTITIHLPSSSLTTALSRSSNKRSNTAANALAESESAFRDQYLATSASIYHKQHHKSPRSFLWRVLEGGKVLSIRSVDVSKPNKADEAYITLHLVFPQKIWNSCIAFSDSKEHDVLSVFVLTDQKTIWTLSLRPDYFRKPSSTEDNVGDWCKSYSPHVLNSKKAHRLVALNSDELLVSAGDGSLVRFYRNSGGDGSSWREQQYSEGWKSSFSSLIHSGSTVSYGDQKLSLSTATSIASPVTILDDVPYVFTVCLDHRLRVWNMATSRIAYIGDIIDPDVEQPEEGKKVIDPSQSQLVRVYPSKSGNGRDKVLCIIYSPHGAGEFKIWGVSTKMDGSLEFDDLFPRNSLIPVAPTTDIWTLADFSVVVDQEEALKLNLWALWKNNMSYRLHSIEFQSGSVKDVQNTWEDGWNATSTEKLRTPNLPTISSADSTDGTDKWLEFILSPGRFSALTIETALALYERRLGSRKDLSRKNGGSLADRMCTAIGSATILGRKSDGTMNHDVFRTETDTQWRSFYRLLGDLDKYRGEAMSLVIDPHGQMPWVILADGLAAVRVCSRLELIVHNTSHVDHEYKRVAKVLDAAAEFRSNLPYDFVLACKSMLSEEIFQEPSHIPVARMQLFYEQCDFRNQIGDEDFNQLNASLDDWKYLTGQMYDAMLDLMTPDRKSAKRSKDDISAEYGNNLIVRGAQETVALHRSICLDQLVLLVLVQNELNGEEDSEHPLDFETSPLFSKLLEILSRLELLHWLSSTQMTFPLKKIERSSSIVEKSALTKKPAPCNQTVTVLEKLLQHLLALDDHTGKSMSTLVTHELLEICAPSSEYEFIPAVVLCFLLKSDRADLAMEFSKFVGSEPFSVYVQGRACLAYNDPLTAAALFKKAAFGMSYPNARQRVQTHSAGYLDETEKSLLNAGLPEYYSHIVALFDKEKNYSFVIDFARLSLQFIKPIGEVQSSYLRTEMQSRLFNAALQTSRYDIAHSVLALVTDSALRTSSLRTLVTKMCETSNAADMINLPFVGLQDAVDEILAQKCQSIVTVTAGVPYHNILYAWRIKRSDFRGAAAVSLDRLQKLQASGDGDKMLSGEDGLETPVTRQYITLINALSCVDPKQAWILHEEPPPKLNGAFKPGEKLLSKRKVVKLDDIRRGYQDELDRIAAIQNNQFAFGGGDEMDVI